MPKAGSSAEKRKIRAIMAAEGVNYRKAKEINDKRKEQANEN